MYHVTAKLIILKYCIVGKLSGNYVIKLGKSGWMKKLVKNSLAIE